MYAPIVISLTFNEALPDLNYLIKKENIFNIDTLIYCCGLKNISNSYWSDVFGGTFPQFSTTAITVTVGGTVLTRVYTTENLINKPNSFLYLDNVVYVHIDFSNTNARASLGFTGALRRLDFVNNIVNFENPSDTEIDGYPSYPILNINNVVKEIDDNIGGISFVNAISFEVMNHLHTPLAFGGVEVLKYAVGSNLYNSSAVVLANRDYVNAIDEMDTLFKGFITNFSYNKDGYKFTIEDFKTTFSDTFCHLFNRADYFVSGGVYADNDDYVPYLFGSMEVELIEIASKVVSDTITNHYYIAIDKACNPSPFDLNKVYDSDHRRISGDISLLNNHILVWADNSEHETNNEPDTAFVTGDTENKVLDIIKQMIEYQRLNWVDNVDEQAFIELYDSSPRVNLYIDDDTSTKEIINAVCEDDMLYVFPGSKGKITFSHWPAYKNKMYRDAQSDEERYEAIERQIIHKVNVNDILDFPEVDYSESFDKFVSQITMKHNQVKNDFQDVYISARYKDRAISYFNKSVNATIESHLADQRDVELFAENYFFRFNQLAATIKVKLAHEVYDYQLLDVINLDLSALNFELFIHQLWCVKAIDYNTSELTLEELPNSIIHYYNLSLDEIEASLDTEPWVIDATVNEETI